MNFKEYLDFDENLPNIDLNKVVDETTPLGIESYYNTLMDEYIKLKNNIQDTPKVCFKKGCEIICKVTNYCNQNCSYCFDLENRKRGKEVLSKERILKLLILLLEDGFIDIEWIWHGGECLSVNKEWLDDVCFCMEKEVIKYKAELTFSIQSNATLLDDEWIKIIDKYNMGLGSSYDWSAQSQRGYSLSEYALSKINYFITVVTNKNINTLIEDYENAKKMEVPFSFNFVFGAQGHKTNDFLSLDKMIPAYKKYFDYFLYDQSPQIIERSASAYIGRVIGREAEVCHLGNCLNSNRICINSNGDLLICDTTSIKEIHICSIDEINSISEFFSHPNRIKLINLKEKQINDNCLNCDLLQACGQGCLHCTISESNGIKPYSYQCTFFKAIAPYIYEKIGNLTPEEFVKLNPSVKQYLIQHRYLPAYKKEELKELWKL